MSAEPETLIQAIRYFANPQACIDLMVSLRWPDGVVRCPTCNSDQVTFLPKRSLFQCKAAHPRKQFSVKVGTIFEDSPISLDKWLCALWMIANDKNGISSYEVARGLGVTQKTAWFLMHRIRLAMQAGSFDKPLDGTVEVDETFVGGKAKFMHRNRTHRAINGRGPIGKTTVVGLLTREGPNGHSVVRASVTKDRKVRTLGPLVRKHVKPGSHLITDSLPSYNGLDREYVRGIIDHEQTYVEGQIHTNGIENFWTLVKRCIKGTYVQVEPAHLFRYIDEEVFRFNSRYATDGTRFLLLAARVIGRRLTYNQLTGKTA